MMEQKKEVYAALGNWVIKVAEKGASATPEEIAALPEVANVYLNNQFLSRGPSVKKENTDSINSFTSS